MQLIIFPPPLPQPITPPEFKVAFSKRRSNAFNRLTEVIPEDDSISATPSKALQEHQPLNLMSSTINESPASRSTLLDEMDKENLHSPDSMVRSSPTKRRRHIIAHLNDDDVEQQSPALGARLDAIETKLAETQGTLRDLNWFLHFKLWTLEDTDLALMRSGLAEVNETVSQIARSDPFLRQFEALKQENAVLRSQLRADKGEWPADVAHTLGFLG